METKYFKKVYEDRTAYGQWKTGDGINYNESGDNKYTVEFITENEFIDGVKNIPEIPKTKEQLIEDKKREIAIEALKVDGVLDSKGEIILTE